MRIVVFGFDGFCAWPMSLQLACAGHEVIGVDNYSRRLIDSELGSSSLTPISSPAVRQAAARDAGANIPQVIKLDVTDYYSVYNLLRRFEPEAIFHTAEIRSAPYSMISDHHKNVTISNNIAGTHNILNAIVALKMQDLTHLVHIGTMGVYGYGGTRAMLPEGYADITIHGQDAEGNPVDDRRQTLYPTNPGSIYHMTKSMEQIMFAFYAKNNGLRITDLHQGIIWGSQTDLTLSNECVINRLDYDQTYGTVLNRFLIQAALEVPLTVYGTGGQTRAFIHIRDSVRCVQWAIEDYNYDGRVRIINQVTEFESVANLARAVVISTGATIKNYENPRKELAENTLVASNAYFKAKGLLNPVRLADNLLLEYPLIQKHRDRADLALVPPSTKW